MDAMMPDLSGFSHRPKARRWSRNHVTRQSELVVTESEQVPGVSWRLGKDRYVDVNLRAAGRQPVDSRDTWRKRRNRHKADNTEIRDGLSSKSDRSEA